MATSTLQGTGNQPYTPQRVDYLASYLQSLLPGMTHETAVKWINAERGVNGNVLGLTYHDSTGQHLYTYSSQEAGLRAAASHVKSSSNYTGIVASLTSGSTAQQLVAITQSPWNARNSPYYQRVFGIKLAGSPSPSIPKATLASDITSAQADINSLNTLGINTSPSHVFTRAEATTLVTSPRPTGYGLAGDLADSAINKFVGRTVGEWTSGQIDFVGVVNPLDIAGQIGNVAAGLGNAIGFVADPQNWAYLGALVIGIPLTLLGFYLLAGVPTGGENA